jgi:hypothetical protein
VKQLAREEAQAQELAKAQQIQDLAGQEQRVRAAQASGKSGDLSESNVRNASGRVPHDKAWRDEMRRQLRELHDDIRSDQAQNKELQDDIARQQVDVAD